MQLTNSGANIDPSASPDGSKIVFAHEEIFGNFEIYTMNTDGSNMQRLTNVAGQDWWPVYSPDGTKIAFVSNRDGAFGLYIMDADGTNQRKLTLAATSRPSFSSDGTKIIFLNNFNQISTINIDGSNLQILLNEVTGDWPTYSPRTPRIVYVEYIENGAAIYIMNEDGTNPTKITSTFLTEVDTPSLSLKP